MIFILFIIVGLVSGVLAGLVGVGGGIVIIPALIYIFKKFNIAENEIIYIALSTSLASIILPTIRACFIHYKNKNIRWEFIPNLIPTLALGTIIGVVAATKLSASIMENFFGGFLLLIALNILRSKKELGENIKHNIPKSIVWIFGVFTGIISGLLGIGGGTLLIPFFNYNNYSIHKAISTSSILIIIISIVGTIVYSYLSFVDNINYIYWPAVLWISLGSIISVSFGTKLGKILSEKTLRRICAFFFFIIGLKLIMKNI